jgi:muconolactone delta-isomerase
MLFAVKMDVDLPVGMDPGERSDLLAREKAYSHELQRAGKWPRIWRIVGQLGTPQIAFFLVAGLAAVGSALALATRASSGQVCTGRDPTPDRLPLEGSRDRLSCHA